MFFRVFLRSSRKSVLRSRKFVLRANRFFGHEYSRVARPTQNGAVADGRSSASGARASLRMGELLDAYQAIGVWPFIVHEITMGVQAFQKLRSKFCLPSVSITQQCRHPNILTYCGLHSCSPALLRLVEIFFTNQRWSEKCWS